MPAVANAVFDAVGVRVDEIPVSPEKVFRGMELKARGKEGRVGPRVGKLPEVRLAASRASVKTPWQGGDGKEQPREAGGGARPEAHTRTTRSPTMLRLPPFTYHRPKTVADAVEDRHPTTAPSRCTSRAVPISTRT